MFFDIRNPKWKETSDLSVTDIKVWTGTKKQWKEILCNHKQINFKPCLWLVQNRSNSSLWMAHNIVIRSWMLRKPRQYKLMMSNGNLGNLVIVPWICLTLSHIQYYKLSYNTWVVLQPHTPCIRTAPDKIEDWR